ncbi:antibiotic biosynthesis monooxygenase family protein [uncultured Pontibacter sp.]|uniref:putative quinol monooxygenase n=1 Tax=uncultured Pontibacter sp. TaxID=453356 RepID=UPI00263A0C85|nr:antibiotic biosynthesis monooxygenase family protein [uncultured Pontibacter sp.]
MNKYGLHGKLNAQAGRGNELASILLQASALVSTAKGCHLYLVSKDAADADCIWITEVWDTREDHDKSLHLDGVGALISQAIPLLAGKPEKGLELEVLGGLPKHIPA